MSDSTAPSLPKSFPNNDDILLALVTLANEKTMTIGITLSVGGILISGELASGKDYLEVMGDQLASAFQGLSEQSVETIRAGFKDLANRLYTPGTNSDEVKTEYIHIRNARYYIPGNEPIPTTSAIWWRGRLECVDGFTIGKFQND
jgi:hypothetical protein